MAEIQDIGKELGKALKEFTTAYERRHNGSGGPRTEAERQERLDVATRRYAEAMKAVLAL